MNIELKIKNRIEMKTIFGMLMVVWSVTVSVAQSSGELIVPLSDPAKRGKLKASLNTGSIFVKGTNRKDVLIKYSAEVDKNTHNRGGERNGLKRIGGGTMDLEAVENQNFVRVQSNSWSNKLNLDIEVPIGFDLVVSTYNDGDLEVYNIQGEVELKNYNGEITAANISGSVVATTYNGEVKVSFDKVTEGAPMSFTTWNGDIELVFPATMKATFKMKSEQGEVLSDFDMKVIQSGPVKKEDTRAGVYKVVVDEWVKGEINGGGPEIMMKNYNGDIIIRKK